MRKSFIALRTPAVLAVAVLSLVSQAKTPELTREFLLQGSPVPERREFPLSTKVKACTNFHQYVCGELESSFQLPADRSEWTFSFTDNAERLLHVKKNYFKWLSAGGTPKTSQAKPMKNFYLACMDEKSATTSEKKTIDRLQKEIMGLKNPKALASYLESRVGTGDPTWLSMGRYADQADPIKYDTIISFDAMTLPERSYYEKEEARKDLRDLALDFFQTLKIPEAPVLADKVLEFEVALSKIHPLPAELRQRWAGPYYMTKEEWLKRYPQLSLNRLMGLVPKGIQIRNVIPESFEFLNSQLTPENFSTLQAVFLFQSLSPLMDDAYPEHFKKRYAFNQKHRGAPPQRPDRQERCTQETMGAYMMELDHELIPILFPNFPDKMVAELAEKVRQALLSQITANQWLTPAAKEEALAKVSKSKMFLVKPSKEKDWNFNPRMSFDPKDRQGNLRKFTKANFDRDMSELGKPRNLDEWWLGPLVLNAYFSPVDNKFVMLQGILQHPFFAPDLKPHESLGAIGTVVGHELGHGIDDQGARYDSAGRVRQWMDMKDLAEFRKRGEIFVQRLNKINHNGELKLGETIGDHVGLTASYKAAFPDPSKASPEAEREFFVAYARMWCSKALPSREEMRIKTAPHPLGRVRINEQVIHLPAFAKAFSCKKGDPMFLPEKEQARVWQ